MNLPTELRRTYHLADVDPAHPIRRAADELERLGAERDALREERDRMQMQRDALAALLAEARCALSEVRAHMHAAGRRPEECYEMSVIDDALRSE